MSDFADLASEREELDRDLALLNSLFHNETLAPMGYCYNCDESLPEGVCFCDIDCRNDFEARLASQKRSGGRS